MYKIGFYGKEGRARKFLAKERIVPSKVTLPAGGGAGSLTMLITFDKMEGALVGFDPENP